MRLMQDAVYSSQLGLDQFSAVALLCALLFVLALRSVWRSTAHSRKAKLFWTVLCVIPLLGPAAWFAAGSQRKKHR
jgi:magnesium-transporting ATPase (P-type)